LRLRLRHGVRLQTEQADPGLVRASKLGTCFISQEQLRYPVVADLIGNLYNKAAVLEYLLAKKHGMFATVEAKTR
jgi:Rtf2 RING-finger